MEEAKNCIDSPLIILFSTLKKFKKPTTRINTVIVGFLKRKNVVCVPYVKNFFIIPFKSLGL